MDKLLVVLFLLKSVCVHARSQMWVRSCRLKLTLCAVCCLLGRRWGWVPEKGVNQEAFP